MPVNAPGSSLLRWAAIIIALAALVPIVAMTLAVAAVAWIPIAGALVILAVVLAVRSKREA
jgi:hypothetical protein